MQVNWQTSHPVTQERFAFDIHQVYDTDPEGNLYTKGFTFYQFVPKLGGFYHDAGTYDTVAEGQAAINASLTEENTDDSQP